MKICFISNLYAPWIIGGAEVYVENIARALSAKHEVLIITSEPFNGIKSLKARIEVQDKIKIYRFYPANVYHTYYAKKRTDFIKPIWHMIDLWNPHSYLVIRSILKKEMPDIVHTHNLGGISSSAFYAAKDSGIPVVHTLHDYSFICPRATLIRESSHDICVNPAYPCRIYRKLKKMTTDKADVIISPSGFVLDIFNKAGFFSSSAECIILPLGMDISIKAEKKQKDTFDVLYIGQIAKHKGIDVLIKAINELSAENLRLHIVGVGSYYDDIKKLVDSSRIKFHGFVSVEQKTELFLQADVCIVPSTWFENSPVVVYESFCHGVPVIGSRIGGIPELIRDGYNGLLFEAGNANELANLLQYLMNHPDELKKLSKGALESSKLYNIQEHINKLENIYLSSIARSSK